MVSPSSATASKFAQHHISDCIEATVMSMNTLPGETYNIGGKPRAYDIIHN